MGGGQSKTGPSTNKPTTVAPTTTAAPCLCNYPKKELHLVLAFLAGILLTLLLVAVVFLVIKSYRKCHSSPQALDSHSDSLAKFSTPREDGNSASMDFKTLKETRDHWSASNSADSNSVVYAQIQV